ncbi:MAG: tctC6 [Proteobacteria bacterium]|nr:tctC6 [Pseudomonadota bacterium]
MKNRRGYCQVISVLVAAGGLAIGNPAAAAEGGWQPQSPVEIVVPTGAGGENDRVARFIQRILEQKKLVTTPVTVVNKAGGNQVLATVHVAKKTADPHVLLYATGTIQSNEIAGVSDLSYRDLTPIAKLRCDNTAVTVAPDSHIKDMPDLIRKLKADVKSVSFGTASRGGANNLVLAKALRSGGVDPNGLKLIVFKTNAQTMTAVMGKHVDSVGSSVSAAFKNVEAGKLRLLAVSAPKRLGGILADVPTMAEAGLDVRGVSNCRYVYAPKGISAAQRSFWEKAMAAVNDDEEWKSDISLRNQQQDFVIGKDLEAGLEDTYNATKAAMVDIGLAKK